MLCNPHSTVSLFPVKRIKTSHLSAYENRIRYLIWESSCIAGRSHHSNKKIRQSAPNCVLFRSKVEVGSSVAVGPNTNELPSEVDTELDLLYTIADSATAMLACQGGSVPVSCHFGLWLLHL